MKILLSALAAILGLFLAVSVTAQEQEPDSSNLPGSPVFEATPVTPSIDFSGVQAQLGGEPTQILVLGTIHLGNLSEEVFDPTDLALVVDRLEAFAPDIIAIETVGGRTCDELRRYAELYPGVANNYCSVLDVAHESLGISQLEAAVETAETISRWPDIPSAEDRRHLAALLFGAGEPWSAALQWSRLDAAERIAANGVNQALADRLDRILRSRNENNLLGIALAGRLGLETLAAMDDHSADIIQSRAPEEFGDVIQSVWQTDHPQAEEYAQLEETFLGSPERVRDGYRFYNSAEYQQFVIEKDFGLAAATPDMEAVARHYVAWWQTRNLRMVANIIEAAGNRPGARVLVIVGASHKPYIEAYLDQMHDIELVSVDEVLSE